MQITAAVVEDADAPFVLGDIEIAEPRLGEVLVRIVAVGVCHTDLVARSGGYPTPFPCVLGHEGSGVVHSVGPGVTPKPIVCSSLRSTRSADAPTGPPPTAGTSNRSVATSSANHRSPRSP